MKNIISELTHLSAVLGLVTAGLFTVCVTPGWAQSQHGLFTDILQDHVREGLVASYPALKNDGRFEKYIRQLNTTDPAKISDANEQMAFWINAYNAFTLKVILDNYPLKSINELHTGGLIFGSVFNTTIWDKKIFTVNGEQVSLNMIEHEILRKDYDEPRIHFAVNCASIGCPPLLDEAYEGATLDAQLTEQAKTFLGNQEKNRFDTDEKVAFISPIFKWFKKDFGEDTQQRLLYISQFLPMQTRQAMRNTLPKWKVKYTYYDWGLNEWK
jgi:hypothetical protein